MPPIADDKQQILKLFEDGDRALITADVAELSRIFADDYVQYDESAKSFTKRDPVYRNDLHGPPNTPIERECSRCAWIGGRRSRARRKAFPCSLHLHGCSGETRWQVADYGVTTGEEYGQ